jgi:hypothetical protein
VVDLSSGEQDAFPTPHGTRRSSKSSSMTSIVDWLGHPAMAMSLSSMTPMKRRRKCARMTTPMRMPCYLLLRTLWPQPPPPLLMMTHPMRCKVIVVAVEMRPVCLRLPCQKECLQDQALKNLRIIMTFVLLHHKFFCKKE